MAILYKVARKRGAYKLHGLQVAPSGNSLTGLSLCGEESLRRRVGLSPVRDSWWHIPAGSVDCEKCLQIIEEKGAKKHESE